MLLWGRMGSVHSPRPRQDTRSPDLPRFLKDRTPLEQRPDSHTVLINSANHTESPSSAAQVEPAQEGTGGEWQSTAALSSEP